MFGESGGGVVGSGVSWFLAVDKPYLIQVEFLFYFWRFCLFEEVGELGFLGGFGLDSCFLFPGFTGGGTGSVSVVSWPGTVRPFSKVALHVLVDEFSAMLDLLLDLFVVMLHNL